jgi:hypothetical protein
VQIASAFCIFDLFVFGGPNARAKRSHVDSQQTNPSFQITSPRPISKGAVANAIYNAISVRDCPITLDKFIDQLPAIAPAKEPAVRR